jgi:hypothetical protein
VGCDPVEAMAHGLGDERRCSSVMATVACMDVLEDLAAFL